MRTLQVIVVGDEILQGRRTEANASWIGREAADLGVPVRQSRIVSDEPGALVAALHQMRGPGIDIVVTGGLGPTRDDRTRAEAAEAFGMRLETRPEALSAVESSYARRGIPMDPAAVVQALIPEGAEMVPNPVGTAPGFRIVRDGCTVTCLPGVPREMRAMWAESIVPRLAATADAPGVARWFTHGLGESSQESLMADLALDGVEFCSLPGPWGVELQCRVAGGNAGSRQHRAEAARAAIVARQGASVVRPLGATLLESFAQGLRRRAWRVVFAESCTAGMAASRMADLPGVSDVFAGGVVAYANHLKTSLLGVDPDVLESHGAVSEATALAMARGARGLCPGEGLGLAVTGIAGPDGGTPDKPVGTVWIAAASSESAVAERLSLVGSRDLIRERAAWRLLGLGWRQVVGEAEAR